jgi:hypothetical protein
VEDESHYPLGSLLQDDSVAVISSTGAHAVGIIDPLNAKLTLNLLTTTIVAPPSNASKWQMGFNSAFKGLNPICHLLALLGAHHILHVGSIRLKGAYS